MYYCGNHCFMLFNTKEFAAFFAVIFVIYWLLFKWRNLQNLLLLAGSMYFYAQLHYSFPIYLTAIIITSYLLSYFIGKNENHLQRKTLLVTGLCIISAGLLYTKYSGLFFIGIKGLEQWQASVLHILTPVGISFYTFSTLGYITDVYRRKIPAEKNLLTYATYISFFPHLLSGPIPSAATILPQFSKKAEVSLSSIDESVGEILWGLFQKMVVADNISLAVSFCFSQSQELNGSTLFIGVALFGIQLYADFAGYSNIAKGVAGLLGITLLQNFRLPFSSKSVTEYWRRWHISLTNWFYEYIFNPIVVTYRNWGIGAVVFGLMLTFSISGLWHGAGWQFVVWGLLHGAAMVYEALSKRQRKRLSKSIPAFIYNAASNLFVLLFLGFAWVFFRADSVRSAGSILSRIFSKSIAAAPTPYVAKYLLWCLPLIIIEWLQRKGAYTMDITQWIPKRAADTATAGKTAKINYAIKACLYLLLCISIYLLYKKQNTAEYYYFKF